MDYLQYYLLNSDNNPNVDVLNLIINGLSSILFAREYNVWGAYNKIIFNIIDCIEVTDVVTIVLNLIINGLSSIYRYTSFL